MIKSILFRPPVVTSLVTIILLSIILLVTPIGMANNGDFFRVVEGNNLYFLQENEEEAFFGYFVKEYGKRKYYNEIDKKGLIVTSQNLIIRCAIGLDDWVTGEDGKFDIRFLGAIQIGMCALGIYLMVDYLTYKTNKVTGYLIGIVAVLIFGDTAYTAYFNSFFAEGIVYTTFLISMSSILLLQQQRYNRYYLLSLFGISAYILVFAKQQNAPLGVVLGFLAIGIALQQGTKWFKRLAGGLGGTLIVAGIGVYVLIPQEFVNINQYHAMTRGILMQAKDPEASLEELGMNKQYSLLRESIYFDRYPLINVESDQLVEGFYSEYNFVTITLYYFKHPREFLKMFEQAVQNVYSVRPKVIGNYEKTAQREWGAQTHLFTVYSDLKERWMPKTMEFMMIWMMMALVLGIKNRFRTLVIVTGLLMGLSQIVVSIIGAGDADLAKHIFLYAVVFDWINLIGIAHVIIRGSEKLSEKIKHEYT